MPNLTADQRVALTLGEQFVSLQQLQDQVDARDARLLAITAALAEAEQKINAQAAEIESLKAPESTVDEPALVHPPE